jgi:transposase
MNPFLDFNPDSRQLTGPSGSLNLLPEDPAADHFLMLLEGECLHPNVGAVAAKYGYCRQRYYQLLHRFKTGGLQALQTRKTGPKHNYRRTDEAVRQVLRHMFLDPDASAAVVAQKLRQTHFPISLRSVRRIIADYGLQKKTLSTQPPAQKPAAAGLRPKLPPPPASGSRRRPKP